MRQGSIRFDNIYSKSGEYILQGRQLTMTLTSAFSHGSSPGIAIRLLPFPFR